MGQTTPDVAASVDELREQVAELTERLSSLEARLEAFHPAAAVPEEVLLAISAACAAYLGYRAKIKQVRLRRQTSWARQGRSDVHHSHVIR